MSRVWILLFSILLSVFWASETLAQSQSLCGPKKEVLANLASKYQEVPLSYGVTNNGQLMQILVSKSGGWTLLLTYPSGISCLIAAGDSWEDKLPHPNPLLDNRITRR